MICLGAGNLKFEEARDQLRYALRNQKTISIPKLRVLLSSMHVTYKCPQSEQEINYLKNELEKLREEHRRVMRFAKKRGYRNE